MKQAISALQGRYGSDSVRNRTLANGGGLVPAFVVKGKHYRFLPHYDDNGSVDYMAVLNDSDGVSYEVRCDHTPGRLLRCSCPDFQARGQQRECKHVRALLAIERLIRETILPASPAAAEVASSANSAERS